MSVESRILELVPIVAKNRTEFAKTASITYQTLTDLNSGRIKSVNVDFVISILKAYPQINKDWLLFGEGDMILQENIPNYKKLNQPNCTELKEHLKTAQQLIKTQQDLIEQLRKG